MPAGGVYKYDNDSPVTIDKPILPSRRQRPCNTNHRLLHLRWTEREQGNGANIYDMQAFTITTTSPEETHALGVSLGRAAFPGAVICLSGALGAGKTVLAQGIAEGLGVTESVTSPTFVYVHVHAGSLKFYHVDLYQVSGYGQLDTLGLDEVFAAGGVVAIEWPDRMGRFLPTARLDVAFGYHGEDRVVTLTPTDADHSALLERLRGG